MRTHARLGHVKSQLHWIHLSRGINFVIQLHFPCTHSGLRKGTSLFFWEAGYALNFFRICGCFDAIKRHVHTHTSLAAPMVIAFASTPLVYQISMPIVGCVLVGTLKVSVPNPRGLVCFSFRKSLSSSDPKVTQSGGGQMSSSPTRRESGCGTCHCSLFATHNCYCFIRTSRKNEILDRPMMDDNSPQQSLK